MPLDKLFRELSDYLLSTQLYRNNKLRRRELTSALSTNETYLYNAVKAATSMTLQQYINSLRLKDAKEMLEKQPRITVESVSHTCGFNCTRTFYRLFREKYGMSPTEHRKAVLHDKQSEAVSKEGENRNEAIFKL